MEIKTLKKELDQFEGKRIIFFDGVCNLCNGFIQFVIKRDYKNEFYFAPLQSQAGEKLVGQLTEKQKGLDSIILYNRGKIYTQSSAVLKITTHLSWLWPLSGIFFIVPKFIRDSVYKWVARNRYRWFGKKDQCMIPTPDIIKKFINN